MKRLRVQLLLLAAVLWTVAVVDVATPTRLMRTGQVKGTDFVHFYTLARLGASGRADLFADAKAQRRVQIEAVPESVNDWYPPAYGPQLTLLLGALGFLQYETALVLWIAFTAVAYLTLVLVVGARTRHLASQPGLVLLAAAASPAFWNLVIHGQMSVVALAAVVLAFVALQARRPLLCGLAVGILAYKPSLFVPALAILMLARDWRPLAAAAVSGTAQVVAAAAVVGFAGLQRYGDLLLDSPRLANLLRGKPEQMHSLRAFWGLVLPNQGFADVLYGVSALVAVAMAAAVWRRGSDAGLRMAALVLGMVLSAPHLYVYDLVVLAPVWLWLVDWYLARQDLPSKIRLALYAGYIAPLLTVVTRATHVQLSVVCCCALLVSLWKFGREESDRAWLEAPALSECTP